MTMPREYHRKYSKEYYHKKKQELLTLLGGKCTKCGSLEKLHFHHLEERSFKIGKLLNHAWEEVLAEVQKCTLLCRVCHDKETKELGQLPRGEQAASAKLTEEAVRTIRASVLAGTTKATLARVHGVSDVCIHNVCKRKTWAHVI